MEQAPACSAARDVLRMRACQSQSLRMLALEMCSNCVKRDQSNGKTLSPSGSQLTETGPIALVDGSVKSVSSGPKKHGTIGTLSFSFRCSTLTCGADLYMVQLGPRKTKPRVVDPLMCKHCLAAPRLGAAQSDQTSECLPLTHIERKLSPGPPCSKMYT